MVVSSEGKCEDGSGTTKVSPSGMSNSNGMVMPLRSCIMKSDVVVVDVVAVLDDGNDDAIRVGATTKALTCRT